ncbi:unannotated protein [freshwater metagenome]|uniref:Unannotated protein n=1 Tax=freshwater metagenome TaxID=449393 RepID=A0A6J6A1E9_9ZZZZ
MPRRPLGVPHLASSQRAAHVGAERGVGDARLLNPDDVKIVTDVLAHQGRRLGRRARHVGDADADNGAHELGMEQR